MAKVPAQQGITVQLLLGHKVGKAGRISAQENDIKIVNVVGRYNTRTGSRHMLQSLAIGLGQEQQQWDSPPPGGPGHQGRVGIPGDGISPVDGVRGWLCYICH